MKQITVKRPVEALHWLDNNAHHEVAAEFHPETGKQTHIWYRNHHEKMRVPVSILSDVVKHLIPNPRKFDTRMYALRPSGKRLIRR